MLPEDTSPRCDGDALKVKPPKTPSRVTLWALIHRRIDNVISGSRGGLIILEQWGRRWSRE